MAPILRSDFLPLVERSIQLDGSLFSAGMGNLRHPFVPSDVGDGLIEEIVAESAFHWFDIPAEFPIKTVALHPGSFHAVRQARDPLIPGRDHDELWIHLEGIVPLFLKVAPALNGLER